MTHPDRDFGGGGGSSGGGFPGGSFDGGFGRGRGRRPVTDYGSTMVYYMKNRHRMNMQSFVPEMERPSPSYIVNMLPPAVSNAADCVPAKHLHGSLNKIKHPINVVRWTPEGRRLLTASSSGEFTLWNGMGFNFETIMQAHDSAIRAAVYSNSDDWLLSADQDGIVKYWQPNFNNVKVIQAHTDPIRDLAFAPTDSKFVTASDDSTLKIFDFAGGVEESSLTGHGWDVKSVDWHPTKGLIVSGSKDHLVKLWDPRTGRCLTTFHAHKNTISKTLFEKTRGQVLATCARDQQARIFELRMMRDICILKGHDKDISTLAWHPIHSNLLSTGGSDGSLFHYLCDEPNPPPGTPYTLAPWDSPDPATAPPQSIWPAHKVPYAHEFAIWSLDWHPIGHILTSGSNDRVTRFWTRARPGEVDCFKDKYHLGEGAAEAVGTWDRRGGRRLQREQEELEGEDEAEGLVDQKMPLKQQILPGIPGLPVPASAYADGSNVGGFQSLIPGMGAVPPPLPPPASGAGGLPGLGLPGLGGANPPDFSKLAAMMGTLPPPPPLIPSSGSSGQVFPPPLPLPGNFSFPPGFQFKDFLQQQSGAQPPPPPPPLPQSSGAIPGLGSTDSNFGDNSAGGGGASGIRKRAPLPSQQESLKEAQRGGSFRTAR